MNKYTEELRKVLKESENIALENKDNLVGTEHILLSILELETSISENLRKEGLNYNKVKNKIPKGNKNEDYIFYKKELLKIIEDIIVKKSDFESVISLPTLINKILDDKSTTAYKILESLDIDIESLKSSLENSDTNGINLLIRELAINLNDLARKNELDKVIGRDKEIERVIEVLARKNKNNPILIGEAGVGKTAIVEELARRIVNGNVPKFLKNKEILNLNIASVIAGTKYRGEFEEKLSNIIKELENNNNLILFIDEIHTIVGAGGAEGAIDASNILKPALARGKIKCIGATTNAEFKTSIETDKALERRFQKIYVCEPNEEETKIILKKVKKDYEKFHNVIIPDKILDETIKLVRKYIVNRNEPDKSIDILDEICAATCIKEKNNEYKKINTKIENLNKEKNKYLLQNDILNASLTKEKINNLHNKLSKINIDNNKNKVSINTLKKVLETKTNCTIYELEDKKYLEALNKNLKSIIIGQNEAIDKLTNITSNYTEKSNNLPYSILLKGSTGTGKTLLIKEYSKILKYNLLMLDMNEYTTEISVNKLIGSPAGYVGYDEKNTVFESLKNFPLSIIVIDNYELAHKDVINLIYKILETGELKLSNNQTIKFNNTIFIFTTTNISSKESIGFIKNNIETSHENFNVTINLKDLTKDNIEKIILNKNKNLTEKQIEEIINKSDYKNLGAKRITYLINESYMEFVV